MINARLLDETPLALKEAIKFFAQHPTLDTVETWTKDGLKVRENGTTRTVFLDSFLDGGRRFTTVEEIRRFKLALNGAVRKRVKPRKANGS